MNLRDILNKQALKVEKRTIKIRSEDGEKDCDVYVKVMSYNELDNLPEKDGAWAQAALTILDEKNNPVFTEEQLKELPIYIWMQLIGVSNEVNGAEKKAP